MALLLTLPITPFPARRCLGPCSVAEVFERLIVLIVENQLLVLSLPTALLPGRDLIPPEGGTGLLKCRITCVWVPLVLAVLPMVSLLAASPPVAVGKLPWFEKLKLSWEFGTGSYLLPATRVQCMTCLG